MSSVLVAILFFISDFVYLDTVSLYLSQFGVCDLLIFSKNQLLVSLTVSIVFFISDSF